MEVILLEEIDYAKATNDVDLLNSVQIISF